MKTVFCRRLFLPLLTTALLWSATSARANVYATNIKLNSSTNNLTTMAGESVTVSYILNEPATAGVQIKIFAPPGPVRTIELAPGTPGTLRGSNSVLWDCKDDAGHFVSPGNHWVYITARANGYPVWTQISDDTNPANYVYEMRSIAVNTNPKSPFYGRIFAGNCIDNTASGSEPGDALGILKWNADGSPADEGLFSNGGYLWRGATWAPWKIEVSEDDKVYVNDWTDNGVILAFDQAISNYTTVFNEANWATPYGGFGNGNFAGPAITGSGTNTHIWMCDISCNVTAGIYGAGVVRFDVQSDGTVAPGAPGTPVVAAGPGSDLSLYPYDVAIDKSNRIYVIQTRANPGDVAYRVLRFPAYYETNTTPATVADWKTGSATASLCTLLGIAVDPTMTWVAVSARGTGSGSTRANTGTTIFEAATGTTITNIVAGGANHDKTDVCWDAVGNLYEADNFGSMWRVYSPPGTNQATTVAIQTITVKAAPMFINFAVIAGQFRMALSCEPGVSYILQSSSDLQSWTPVLTNALPAATRGLSVPFTGNTRFYRIVAGQ